MSRFASLLVLVLVACETPPLTIRFTLTDGNSQQCISDHGIETTDCSEVTMACRAVLSLRIVPPNQPDFPYISLCKPLVGAQGKLCSIAGIDLPPPTGPIPEQVLEIQMAVFQRDELAMDMDGNYICPRVEFAANGLPETSVDCSNGVCPVRPAVGGRAFYYPGDEETVVELGCTDISLLRAQKCEGPPTTEVIATVNDFDTWVPVAESTANRLTVSIGEPKGDIDNGFSLTSTSPLQRVSSTGVPTWGAELDFMPQGTLCVEVFEDAPQTTRALLCRKRTDKDLIRIDIAGALLSKTTLTDILAAKGRTMFPEQGLVVGVVLDEFNKPVAGATVNPICPATPPGCMMNCGCTVQYLSADRKSFSTGSMGTSSNGIWISEDARYGSTFNRSGPIPVPPGFGGLVQGKVTIVVLQESAPTGGG